MILILTSPAFGAFALRKFPGPEAERAGHSLPSLPPLLAVKLLLSREGRRVLSQQSDAGASRRYLNRGYFGRIKSSLLNKEFLILPLNTLNIGFSTKL